MIMSLVFVLLLWKNYGVFIFVLFAVGMHAIIYYVLELSLFSRLFSISLVSLVEHGKAVGVSKTYSRRDEDPYRFFTGSPLILYWRPCMRTRTGRVAAVSLK
ncbi:hypothetical protein EV426DRAFT_611876 [Tirmania nivea]|nr:hypothetical protein EV426DRAFT_611876 [Tirmania nivea]